MGWAGGGLRTPQAFSQECSYGLAHTHLTKQFYELAQKHMVFQTTQLWQRPSCGHSRKSRQNLDLACQQERPANAQFPWPGLYNSAADPAPGPRAEPQGGTPARSPVFGGTQRTPCHLDTSQTAMGKKNRSFEPVCPRQVN